MEFDIRPAEGAAKVYRSGAQVLMYVGKVTINYGRLIVVPRRYISDEQLQKLLDAQNWAWRTQPGAWRQGPDGWTTYVSLPVPFRARPLRRSDPHRAAVRQLLCPTRRDRDYLDSAEQAG